MCWSRFGYGELFQILRVKLMRLMVSRRTWTKCGLLGHINTQETTPAGQRWRTFEIFESMINGHMRKKSLYVDGTMDVESDDDYRPFASGKARTHVPQLWWLCK